MTPYELGKAAAMGLPKMDFTQMLGMPGGNADWHTLTKGPMTVGAPPDKPQVHTPSARGSSAIGWEAPQLKPPQAAPAPPAATPAASPSYASQATQFLTSPTVVNGYVGTAGNSAVRRLMPAAGRLAGKGLVRGFAARAPLVSYGMEGLDAAGLMPEVAGGRGLGNPGISSEREFLDSTRPDGTVFGRKDPTGGAMSTLGGLWNASSAPARSDYQVVQQGLGAVGDTWDAHQQANKLQRMQQASQPATWNPN